MTACQRVVRWALVAGMAFGAAAGFAAEPQSSGQPAASASAGVPLVVAGREIFRMRASLGPFGPEARAAAARQRIGEIVQAPQFQADQVRSIQGNGRFNLAYGDRVLFAVLPGDLLEDDRRSHEIAAGQVERALADAIALDRASRAPKRLAWAAVATLLLLVTVATLCWGVLVLSRRVLLRLPAWREGVLRGIHLRGLELVTADAMVSGASTGVQITRAGLILVLVYVAVSVILILFPWTQPYGRASTSFVLGALASAGRAIVGYIPNLFMIALTVVIVRNINRFVTFLFAAVGRGVLTIPGFHPELAAPTRQLTRWLIWILGLVVIFPYLPGSGTPAFQGVGVFVGLMVSLGSAGAIGNLVSGVVLTYTRSFSIGDRVRIADTTGDVVEHGLLSTKIVTIKNEEITIPNGAILGNHIVNYTELAEGKGLILYTSVTIGYDVPWRTVHALLIEAARATSGVLPDPQPFVLQTGLEDFYVRYEINAYTREPQRMATIYGDLRQNIQDRFFSAGVEIMSPHYASLRDGNTAAIPADRRTASHAPGAFRLHTVSEEPSPED